MSKQGVGGMTYTRQIPNFLRALQQQDETGIEGALRRADKKPEVAEREDTEEEQPVIVDAADAVVNTKSKSKGSLRFKGGEDDKSAASRFKEAAFERYMGEEHPATSAEQEAGTGEGGKHVFSSSAAARQKKRKMEQAGRPGGVGAKVLKNKSLLSFDEED